MNKSQIKLSDVKVIFSSFVDEGFGRSITIDASDKKIKDAITKWVIVNNIGKGKNAGIANFKEYEGIIQYTFKLNDYTKFRSINSDYDESSCVYGAIISLVANAFEYDNKFGKGVSSSLQAVVLKQPAKGGNDDALELLLEDEGLEISEGKEEEISIEDIPF